MRINTFLARSSNLSRRAADKAISAGRVQINEKSAPLGADVTETDKVTLDGKPLELPDQYQTIMLNKPVNYICSRKGQGGKTIYNLLPPELSNLKPVGRLDKDSSGLLLLTNDGELAHKLTHPSFEKAKVYEVTLDNELMPQDVQRISQQGIKLEDGLSKLQLDYINDDKFMWRVTMTEGRNRQIRRTFEQLGYKVLGLHRTSFGDYRLGDLPPGQYKPVNS